MIIKSFVFVAVGTLAATACAECAANSSGGYLRYKNDFLRELVKRVPGILNSQDPRTGRFGTGIWIVNDQHPMFPLAVAWATKSSDNPYYHDPRILEAIMAAGDALIEDADADGRWEFRKKDGSTWGQIYQPWTYSRWVRAYGLIRDGMPPERRKRWEAALIRGYAGIAKTQLTRPVNIPAHHAMGLYIAGQLFDKPEWCDQAKAFMAKVVAAQDPVGFWTEHYGPVVRYSAVYIDALGVYYAVSRDESVLGALKRAAEFHAAFTYPDGSSVETVDERNPYHGGSIADNVGFSFTPEGRGYLLRQWSIRKPQDADSIASFLLYGEEGPAVPSIAAEQDRRWVSEDRKALVERRGKWFVCLSAYCCPVDGRRWIQDRQNFVSVFHDKLGLILGGGNTKLQPLWSNFTVGDVSLLRHTPGDTNPKFTPPKGLVHIPTASSLVRTESPGLLFDYDGERCKINVGIADDSTVIIRLSATTNTGRAVAAHLTFLPHLGQPFACEQVAEKPLGTESFTLSSKEAGRWIEHAGWRLSLPDGASVTWPVLPHNPYVKDGAAKPAEGRIVVSLPFSQDRSEYELKLEVRK